jgi:putative endopeptidase
MKRFEFKKTAATFLAFAMTVVLVACGGGTGGSKPTGGNGTEQTASASGELAGKPWVTSIIQGNLPTERPEAKDDLYTHYAYDYLAAHQEQPGSLIEEYATELQTTNIAVIKDASKSNHDLDQLRILFNQAADTETLHKAGLSEVQPYLDRIDKVTSIEEMNALLAADDFPFSPFITAILTQSDMRDVNIVGVFPNLMFSDPFLMGGLLYQDSDDPQTQESLDRSLLMFASDSLMDLLALGMKSEEVGDVFSDISSVEKTYAKYLDYSGKYSQMDFGANADAVSASYTTLDELCAACPNFPMQQVLDKLGKGGSPRYAAAVGWVEAFNGVWTNENLDTIKLMARLKVLNETRQYRDPSAMNELLEQEGRPVPDAEAFAYKSCDSLDTFAAVLANTYVNEGLGTNAKDRLTQLTQDLVNTYKELVANTTWVGEESREHIIEKLDHININVLVPTGSYYDYSELELTPVDQGGTLLGNYLKLKQYRLDQESKLVGQPASAAIPWFMIKPTTTNCFYEATSNSINILPGYVTSLLYTSDMSDEELLAGIGFVIGHEISHGFDYTGSQFDAYGTPNPVFADADVNAFIKKTSELASYYKGIEVAPDAMVNGDIVVTEAAADLCGMHAVLELAGKSDAVDYDKFFSSITNPWAQVISASTISTQLLDSHPLNNLRININAQMFDPIYEKLGVKEGDGMYLAPEQRINVWGSNA